MLASSSMDEGLVGTRGLILGFAATAGLGASLSLLLFSTAPTGLAGGCGFGLVPGTEEVGLYGAIGGPLEWGFSGGVGAPGFVGGAGGPGFAGGAGGPVE